MSEKQIAIGRPEDDSRKSKARVASGKRLGEYNRAMRKREELGDLEERPEGSCESNNNDSEDNSTRVMILAGLAGLAYYLYTTNARKVKEDKKEKVQHVQEDTQHNTIQEDKVNGLRSFK